MREHLTLTTSLIAPASAQSSDEPIYYQDPDGKPVYSLTPRKAADGRAFRAVPASADLNFDDDAPQMPPPPPVSTTRKIKFYRNPMGLADTSPVPKKDSMGMDYIPVYEGDDSDDGAVKLSPGKIQRSGVKSEPAMRRQLRAVIRAPGVIQLDERRVSVIAMRSESFVQSVADVTTGSRVRKGQPLMQIYSSAISSAAADYVSTIGSRATSSVPQFGRGSRQRLINLDVPEAAIAAMDKTGVAPVTIEWQAPRDGVVLERSAIEGMRAQPGDVLFRIADISKLWATIEIAERDLGALAPGQMVMVHARAFPGRSFHGEVKLIYPQLNKEARTARVRIELDNPDLTLLPEMYVDAEIDTGGAAPVLAVPDSAVLDSGSKQVVFVDKGDGRYEPRAVKLGQRGSGAVEIRDGLAEGESVVISANFLIDAESNLNAALKTFSAEGAQP
ncbi:efflux RND transporter periplasmic adaptor subunit [Rhodopseudomonas sp. HC1]|uniref:efflux RND transporter periplasmic adaptor subunit n=1 Tax=Rhodopseudomonas infernalis TaxID=2897386 RepID=UPI001EE89AFA|nr:efflux RND transporter periplasmic adaptor subunit [Rhodopseudomonas infernalis]MCG6205495.1 efflux RND transporter periplasmic adaptor subunit [Rhodopseudomonas infernalis]